MAASKTFIFHSHFGAMTMILIICLILCHNSATAAGNDVNGVKLSIGNPPVDVYGIADTGSDLLWPQCVPCEACYKQINPKFDPKMSSTYSGLPCAAQECQFIPTSCSLQILCCYDYEYEDDSVTKGVLAKETITLRSTSGEAFSLKNIVFGCGHNNTGTLSKIDMGIFGLGGGPYHLFLNWVPCLEAESSTVWPHFILIQALKATSLLGKVVKVLGEGVVSTPLVLQDNLPFYHVTVKGISFGGKFLPFDSSGKVSKGNMYLDSGTPTTYKSTDLYDRLVAELKKQIPMKPVEDDPNLGTQLFYKSKTNLRGPILTVHFEGDADVRLTPTDIHSTKRWGFLLCNDK